MPLDSTWIWQQKNWPAFYWNQETLSPWLIRARLAQSKIIAAIQPLDNQLVLDLVAAILVEDGLTTSAIEGERLDKELVRASVARHLGLLTANLPNSPRPVDGVIEVLLDAARNFDKPLTLEYLFNWQATLFPSGCSESRLIRTGMLRGEEPMKVISGSVENERVHFIAPPHDALEKELEQFLQWFNQDSITLDGLIRAGLAHFWFVTLHPFQDGNGRVARAITDRALSQDEKQPMRLFSVSAQILGHRDSYYDILERSQRGSLDITEWLMWFLQQIEAAAHTAEKTLARTLTKNYFWQRHQHTELNQTQRKVLNRLLDSEPEGFKGGINIRKYMSLTKTSRAKAYDELNDLVEKQCLGKTEKGLALLKPV